LRVGCQNITSNESWPRIRSPRCVCTAHLSCEICDNAGRKLEEHRKVWPRGVGEAAKEGGYHDIGRSGTKANKRKEGIKKARPAVYAWVYGGSLRCCVSKLHTRAALSPMMISEAPYTVVHRGRASRSQNTKPRCCPVVVRIYPTAIRGRNSVLSPCTFLFPPSSPYHQPRVQRNRGSIQVRCPHPVRPTADHA
jgi:hypothetical protein